MALKRLLSYNNRILPFEVVSLKELTIRYHYFLRGKEGGQKEIFIKKDPGYYTTLDHRVFSCGYGLWAPS